VNCDLCPEKTNVALLGVAGGPMFCDVCLLAILLELQNDGSLRRIMATIRARRKQEKGTAQSSLDLRRAKALDRIYTPEAWDERIRKQMLKKDEEGER
jgi:hypothetical protein